MTHPQHRADVDHEARARFEASRTGQALLTFVLLVLCVALLVQNLPASVIHRDLQPLDDSLHGLGIDQDWTVFSPDPRPATVAVHARLTYADGTVTTWAVPDDNPITGAYRAYRWQKWQERVPDHDYVGLWAPTALWLSRTQLHNGQRPTRVELVHDNLALVPIDAPRASPPAWTHETFYTYNVPRP